MTHSSAPVAGDQLLQRMDAEQRAVVESTARRLCVSAAPGSGKTATLVARIVWMLRMRAVPAHAILTQCFTRAAAQEIRGRVADVVGNETAAGLDCLTSHGLAVRLIRLDPGAVGLPDRWRVADEDEVEEALRSLYEGPERRPASERAAVTITALREASMLHAAGQAKPDTTTEVGMMLGRWSRRLLERGLVAPDRLLPKLAVLLGLVPGVPASPKVLQAVRRYREVLVDEVQDSSRLELQIVRALDANETHFFDVRQRIFSFRGADGLDWLLGQEGLTFAPLRQSYRCRARIADYANVLTPEAPGIVPAPGSPSEVCFDSWGSLKGWIVGRDPRSVAVLARTNLDAYEAAQALGDLAQLVRREPDQALRVGIAALRLGADPNDNAACRIVLRAIGWSDKQILGLEGRASLARGMLHQAIAEDLVDDAWSAAVGEAPWTALERVLGAAWTKRLSDQEALDILSDRREADAFAEAARAGKVPVCTTHAAKGKEWDAVVLIDFAEREEEDKRVRFVAATRARSLLVVIDPPGELPRRGPGRE